MKTNRSKEWRTNNPEKVKKIDREVAKRRSISRALLQEQDRWIFIDSRSEDRKAGRENDLTREFIRQAIEGGCSYCGETKLRMTLDRMNNEVGHLMSNVVPACIRCNYLRRDMPYQAWMVVSEGMRTARELGLFGSWTGRIK